jgi:hypothetical protein
MQLCYALLCLLAVESCRCLVNSFVFWTKSSFSARRKFLNPSFETVRPVPLGLRLYERSPKDETNSPYILPIPWTQQHGIRGLQESFRARDIVSFQTALFDLDENIRNSAAHPLTKKEKEELLLMVRDVADQFRGMTLVRVLRSMERFGFSVRNAAERPILDGMVKVFLKSKTVPQEGRILFCTAIRKLGFTWEHLSEKEEVLRLLEHAVSAKTTRREFAEIVTALSRLGIPWTTLSRSCQQQIVEKLPDMKNEISLRIIVSFVYDLSSLKGFSIKEQPEIISLTFLQLAEECLNSAGLIKDESMKARQVLFSSSYLFPLNCFVIRFLMFSEH